MSDGTNGGVARHVFLSTLFLSRHDSGPVRRLVAIVAMLRLRVQHTRAQKALIWFRADRYERITNPIAQAKTSTKQVPKCSAPDALYTRIVRFEFGD